MTEFYSGCRVVWKENGVEYLGTYIKNSHYEVLTSAGMEKVSVVCNKRKADTPISEADKLEVYVLQSNLSLAPTLPAGKAILDLGYGRGLLVTLTGEQRGDYQKEVISYKLKFPDGHMIWISEDKLSACPKWEYDGEYGNEPPYLT